MNIYAILSLQSWNSTIRLKLVVLFAILITGIALFISFYFPFHLEKQATHDLQNKAQSIAAMTAFSVSPGLVFEDPETVEAAFVGTQQNSDLVYIIVHDATGQPVATYNQEEAESVGFIDVESGDTSATVYKTQQPILHDGEVIGQLYLGVSLQDLETEIQQSRKATALVSGLIFCIGMSLVWGISTLMAAPIHRIVETVQRIEQGDLTQRAPVETRDEIGRLAKAFNKMVGEIEERTAELQTTQSQLAQSEKLASVGQLAAGVAHEINNPVGFIHSNLGTLKEYIEDLSDLIKTYQTLEEQIEQEDTDAVRQVLEKLQQQKEVLDLDFLLEDLDQLVEESREGTDRVRKIVQNLKEFSHVDKEQGKMPANLNDGLESSLNMAWNEIKYKATVEKEYGDIPEVECYGMELNQVFINLLVNAAQAIPEKGTITIRTFREDGYVCVSISDTGTGMPPEVKNRIFEPFFTTKKVGQGTGLGLSMAFGIMKKHAGEILLDSEEGVGTTFTLKIPLG